MSVLIRSSLMFLPVMIVTLPLPSEVSSKWPDSLVRALQWFAFYTFAGLLTIPWLMCVYQLVTHSVGRTRRIKYVLEERTAPKVVVVMPCYQELPEILLRTVDSIVGCDYPASCLHVFLSFDGDQQDKLFLNTIDKLGVPMDLKTYPLSIDIAYRGSRVTVSRFPHGGKRQCQKRTFKLVDKIYAEYLKVHDNLFVLFIDSDCILDKLCIQNFMYEMELKPGSKRNMLAMTGVITSTTVKNSILTVLQDMEYIHGQLFERSVESGCGAVTCLPGALTILRFSAFRKMAKYYFADKAEQCDDLFDYGKCHLGEDRWLTHLFMIGAKYRYQIQMNTGAFCKTEAVQTFKSLLKQRRRWFLGFITNEACMLTDIRLWKQYPLLLLVRFAQNTIRTTALLFFIMVISLITTSQTISQLPVGFIAVSLGLNWALMMYFGARLGRYKIMLYPLMFIINPFLNWLYMVYGIFTAGQRTWGGPRADAGAADPNTTPQAAIEHAMATGDDLNVVPETFKPAAEAIYRRKSLKTGVLPSSRVEGQFSPDLPALQGHTVNDLEATIHKPEPQESEVHDGIRRESNESTVTASTIDRSIYRPRRIQSFVHINDANILTDAALPIENSASRPDLAVSAPAAIASKSTAPAMATTIFPATHAAQDLDPTDRKVTSRGAWAGVRDWNSSMHRSDSDSDSVSSVSPTGFPRRKPTPPRAPAAQPVRAPSIRERSPLSRGVSAFELEVAQAQYGGPARSGHQRNLSLDDPEPAEMLRVPPQLDGTVETAVRRDRRSSSRRGSEVHEEENRRGRSIRPGKLTKSRPSSSASER